MRRTNSSVIKRWLNEHGETAKAQLSLDAKVSVSVIDKLSAGTYSSLPRPFTRERICAAMGLVEDVVFPLVGSKRGRSAS